MPRDLPVGNGTVLINFDNDYALRDLYFPHVGQENQTKGHPFRFGVWVDGEFSWVGQDWQIERRYLSETLVTDVTLVSERLGLKLTIHDAVDFYLWVYVKAISVENLRDTARQVRLFFNHDFHIFENKVGDTAFYDPRTGSVIHYKKDRWFLINMSDGEKAGVSQWACGNKEVDGLEGTWRDAEDGRLSGNPIAQGSVDSTVGLEIAVAAAGARTVYYWLACGTAYEKVAKLDSIVRSRSPRSLIDRTEHYWRLWVNSAGGEFAGLPQEVIDLYKRSLLIIRTNIDEDGAIVAANDYDVALHYRDTYSYVWPRDGALVANALAMSGHRDLPEKFFRFCLAAIGEDGYLMHKYNPDGTVASSWHPWLRDGSFSLPIQEDETALVVWALWNHFQKFRDVEYVKPLYRRLIINAADFMVEYRDKETGLPLPSYDLWEERYGVHVFTVSAVIGGLVAAANFARAFGELELADKYDNVAGSMRAALVEHLWSEKDGRFCRMATRTAGGYTLDMTVDAANYGLFAFGALPVDDERVASTMKAVRERLWVKTKVGGLARYENDRYHQVTEKLEEAAGNPWFICTLWLAQYEIARAKSPADLVAAVDILRWASERALPSGVLAEQVDPYTNAPLSVSPLTWSHAAFVSCVNNYVAARQRMLSEAAV